MKNTIHKGQGEQVRPNWRRGETFNASEKHWLRKVSLWDNRVTLDESTWWNKVYAAVNQLPADNPDKFIAESLKKKGNLPVAANDDNKKAA